MQEMPRTNRVDGHARLRRLDNLVDDVLVGDGVRLEEQAARLAASRASSICSSMLRRMHRLDHAAAPPTGCRSCRRCSPAPCCGRTRRRRGRSGSSAGDEREVGVELRRLLVVVAGAQLRDVLQAVFGLARDGADLRVHLEVAEAVDDVGSRPARSAATTRCCSISSKRARSSNSAVTSLPFSAAAMSASARCDWLARRYSVILMETTAGSARGLAQKLHEGVHGLVGVRQAAPRARLTCSMMERLRSRQAGHCGRERRVGERGARSRRQTAARGPRCSPCSSGTRVTNSWCSASGPSCSSRSFFTVRGERPLAFQAHRGQAAALLQNALHVLAVVLAAALRRPPSASRSALRVTQMTLVCLTVYIEKTSAANISMACSTQDELQAVAGQLDHAARLARQGDDAQRHALGSEVLRGLGLALGLFAGALLLRLLRLGGAPPRRGARRCTAPPFSR